MPPTSGRGWFTTVDVVDDYVRNQEDIHQMKLGVFTTGSPTL